LNTNCGGAKTRKVYKRRGGKGRKTSQRKQRVTSTHCSERLRGEKLRSCGGRGSVEPKESTPQQREEGGTSSSLNGPQIKVRRKHGPEPAGARIKKPDQRKEKTTLLSPLRQRAGKMGGKTHKLTSADREGSLTHTREEEDDLEPNHSQQIYYNPGKGKKKSASAQRVRKREGCSN